MRRLLLLLLLTATAASSGCIAAVPLLIYAHKNRQASATETPSAATPNAVRVAGHTEPVLEQPGFIAR